MTWAYNMWVAIDQLANTALGPLGLGSGIAGETLSGYWAQIRFENKIANLAVKALEMLDKDHGFDAIERNPATGAEEPHHMRDYEARRAREEECMAAVLAYDYLDDDSMSAAEMGFMRQRLREAMRDKVKGDVR